MHSKSSEMSPTKSKRRNQHRQSEQRIASRFDTQGSDIIEGGQMTPDIPVITSGNILPLAQIHEKLESTIGHSSFRKHKSMDREAKMQCNPNDA